jgi:hypothetical protein
VWCDAATRLDTHLDASHPPGPAWERLYHELSGTPDRCRFAARHLQLNGPANGPADWAQIAEHTQRLYTDMLLSRQPPVTRARPELSVDIGL